MMCAQPTQEISIYYIKNTYLENVAALFKKHLIFNNPRLQESWEEYENINKRFFESILKLH